MIKILKKLLKIHLKAKIADNKVFLAFHILSDISSHLLSQKHIVTISFQDIFFHWFTGRWLKEIDCMLSDNQIPWSSPNLCSEPLPSY